MTEDRTPQSVFMPVCKQQVRAAAWPHIWHLLHTVERAQELRFDTSTEVLFLLSILVRCFVILLSLRQKKRSKTILLCKGTWALELSVCSKPGVSMRNK